MHQHTARFRSSLQACVVGTAFGLASCGGQYSPGAPREDVTTPPAQAAGILDVRVVNPSGNPVAGIDVFIPFGAWGLVQSTDDDGHVRFTDVPATDFDVSIYESGFHPMSREVRVEPDEVSEVTLEVVPAGEATPVVLAARATHAGDASSITVDIDLAVLGKDGLAVPTLTVTDFEAVGSDCAFMWCVMDEHGEMLTEGSYSAKIDAAGFAWSEAPATSTPAVATALLLEQSLGMLEFDTGGRRMAGVDAYLDALTAPDTVAVAAYNGTADAPVLTTYGPFTSDGAQFKTALHALPVEDAADNPMIAALAGMLTWVGARPPDESAGPRNLVLVSNRWAWPDDGCEGSWSCSHDGRAAVAAAAGSFDIPVVALGGNEPAGEIAAITGGSYVSIDDAEQYPVALANLRSILTHEVGFNRLRVVLASGVAGTFGQGHTVWTAVRIRVGMETWLYVPVVVPVT